jgi:serine/threonine protein kinase
MLSIGEVLQNRYRIIRQLGKGGMGAVYEAHDNVFDTTIALKEILIDLSRNSTPKQREMLRQAFEREGKILAKVNHEVFPHVRDYFQDADRQFLIMELVDGDDLAELLEKRGEPFPVENVLNWADALLDALDYLHNLSPPIIHRDIKPQNLKLTSRGKVKLLDFGIAKGDDSKVNTTVTNQTFVAATLHYSPLEQIFRVLDPTYREIIAYQFKDKTDEIAEQNADARSDIYALGATVYHLLTNVLPIDALKRSLEIWAGKPDPLPNAYAVNPQISPEISAVLHKALEIEHDARFASAKEMRTALRAAFKSADARREELAQAARIEEQKRLEAERAFILKERQLIEAEREKHLSQIEARKRQAEFENQKLPVTPVVSGEKTEVLPPGQIPQTQAFVPPTQQIPATENYSSKASDSIETIPAPANFKFTPQNPAATAKPKSSRQILWIAPVLIFVLIALGGGVFGLWLWRGSPPTVTTETNTNYAEIQADEKLPETAAGQGGASEADKTEASQTSPSETTAPVTKSKPGTTVKTQTQPQNPTRPIAKPQPKTVSQQQPKPQKTVIAPLIKKEGAGDKNQKREGAGDKRKY